MSKTTITVESDLIRSGRVMQIESIFDTPPSERVSLSWDVDLPLDAQEWGVGLIVGPSGAGKSTIARELFGDRLVDGYEWDRDRAVVDSFPTELSVHDVTQLLTSVGFGTVPAWLRPFHVLSTGEQFRVTLARAIAEAEVAAAAAETSDDPDDALPHPAFVIDEFTSVVDRQVAKVGSFAVAKAVRKRGLSFVAVTCHYDVIDWLDPDWVYRVDTDDFRWRCLQPGERRSHPPVRVDVSVVDRGAWRVFGPHHYLSSHLAPGARCFGGYVGDDAVAFETCAVFPHPKARDIMQSSRTIVLPDWQGLGIGNLMIEFAGEWAAINGYRLHGTAAHPVVARHFARSPRWKLLPKQTISTTAKRASLHKQHSNPRKLGLISAEYVPRGKRAVCDADGQIVIDARDVSVQGAPA